MKDNELTHFCDSCLYLGNTSHGFYVWVSNAWLLGKYDKVVVKTQKKFEKKLIVLLSTSEATSQHLEHGFWWILILF